MSVYGSISVTKEQKEELNELKLSKSETYNNVIQRLIVFYREFNGADKGY